MTYLLDDEGAGPTTTRSNVEATIQASAKSNVSSGDSVKLYYYINDHLGTPQRLVGENHQTVWEAEYSAFGQANISVELVKQNHRFPGQYFDQESELHYNWHRYYDPELGRYITSDPIGLQGGMNTFGYAYQNPLMYSDPLGLVIVAIGTAQEKAVINNALSKLKNSNLITASQIRELEQTAHTHTIRFPINNESPVNKTKGIWQMSLMV